MSRDDTEVGSRMDVAMEVKQEEQKATAIDLKNWKIWTLNFAKPKLCPKRDQDGFGDAGQAFAFANEHVNLKAVAMRKSAECSTKEAHFRSGAKLLDRSIPMGPLRHRSKSIWLNFNSRV